MQSADWQCEICGDRETELNIHHSAYHGELEPWDYPDDELRCLCRDCHDLQHISDYKIMAVAEFLRKDVFDTAWEAVNEQFKHRKALATVIETMKLAEAYVPENSQFIVGLQELIVEIQKATNESETNLP